MKKSFTLFVFVAMCFISWAENEVYINSTNFPDANFRQYVTDNLTHENPEFFTEAEANAVRKIVCPKMEIADIKGVECFRKLETLNCDTNQISSVNLTANAALVEFRCRSNGLSQFVINENNTKLKRIFLDYNNLEGYIDLPTTKFTYLSLGFNKGLRGVKYGGNRMKPENFPDLVGFYVQHDSLWVEEDNYELDFTHNKQLKYLYAFNTNLNSLNVDGCDSLLMLQVQVNHLNSVRVNGYEKLHYLNVANNHLKQLDVNNNPKLRQLFCQSNEIKSIDLSQNTILEKVYFYKNQIEGAVVFNSPNLQDVRLQGNKRLDSLSGLSGRKIHTFYGDSCSYPVLDLSNNPGLTRVYARGAGIHTLNLDGSEAEMLYLSYGSNHLTAPVDVTKMTKLIHLSCGKNAFEPNADGTLSIDVSNNKALQILSSQENGLTHLDVTNNPELVQISVAKNKIQEIDLSKNTKLRTLSMGENLLNSISLTNCKDLRTCYLQVNNLSTLDLSPCDSLVTALAYQNHLGSVNLSGNKVLTHLNLGVNNLTSIDVANCDSLKSLYLYNNQLTSIDLSNNKMLKSVSVHRNQIPALTLAGLDSVKTASLVNQQLYAKAYPVTDATGAEIWAVDMGGFFENNADFDKFIVEAASLVHSYNYDDAVGHEGKYLVFPRAKNYKTVKFSSAVENGDFLLKGYLSIIPANSDFNISVDAKSRVDISREYMPQWPANSYKNTVTLTLNGATPASLAGTTRTLTWSLADGLDAIEFRKSLDICKIEFVDDEGNYVLRAIDGSNANNYRYDNVPYPTTGNVADGIVIPHYFYQVPEKVGYYSGELKDLQNMTFNYTIKEGFEPEAQVNTYCATLTDANTHVLSVNNPDELMDVDCDRSAPTFEHCITLIPVSEFAIDGASLIRQKESGDYPRGGELTFVEPEDEATSVFPYMEQDDEFDGWYFGVISVNGNTYLTHEYSSLRRPTVTLTVQDYGITEKSWFDADRVERCAFKTDFDLDGFKYAGRDNIFRAEDYYEYAADYFKVWRVVNGKESEAVYLNTLPEFENEYWWNDYRFLKQTGFSSANVVDVFLGDKPSADNPTTITYIVRSYSKETVEPKAMRRAKANESASQKLSYVVLEKHFDVVFDGGSIVTGVTTPIVAKNIKSVKYYDAFGRNSTRPFHGVNIVVTEYTDGTHSVYKSINQ